MMSSHGVSFEKVVCVDRKVSKLAVSAHYLLS